MTKIAISGYYGFKNFGDETILSVLVNHLKGLDITVFSSDIEYTSAKYNINTVNSFDIKNVVKTIKESDILISGGGSLLQDVTSLKSLVYYSLVIALALLFNKKTVIFAQGIGPINNKFARSIVKNLLKLCTIVTVRDEKSLQLLNSWGINAKLVCDPVYSLNIQEKEQKNIVGIQLRDFKTMNQNLLNKLAQFTASKFPDKKIEIFSLQKSQDLQTCLRFEQTLKSINPNIKTEIIQDNIIEKISELEYFIAMRFHAILCALKCGIKTCAINYDIKVEKLAQDAQIPTISMNATESMEGIFEELKLLDREKLKEFCRKQQFDWEDFDNLFFIK